jgi:AcrR family transcriptional regulator
MTTQHGRRERKDVRRNLERVLQAAHELFAERGGEVTMEEVARRAGVGVGTIYRRFPSKEHLFAAVSQAVCADTRHCLRQAADGAHDPIARLRAVVFVQCERNARQSALLAMRPAPATEPPGGEPAELYQALHELLAQAIIDGQRQGLVRPGDPTVLAALTLELLDPRAFCRLAHVAGDNPGTLAEQVLQFILSGLGARDRMGDDRR